jgi:hypothetical protein
MKLRKFYIALCFTLASAHLAAAAEDEYKVKAAMVYNFAKFVEWPANSFGGDNRITYCIAGKSPLIGIMLNLQGKEVKERTVFVRHIDSPNDLSGCQLLFIAQSEKARLSSYLQQSNHHNILTVSDLELFAASGGMIGLTEVEKKIRFEINQETAQKQGLKISSHLLNLSRKTRL